MSWTHYEIFQEPGGGDMFQKLEPGQAATLLKDEGIARLGCICDSGPYVVPINYYYENGYAYSHSLPGRKISALRKNPSACLQVDRVEGDLRWRSVLAFGEFEEIMNPHEKKEVLGKLLDRFPRLTPVESILTEDAGPPQPIIVFRIRIDRITGLAEG
jgi:nitroimidazol reductase NimA-like FMN-containing flavoprotein (pyridoxamine 5'-phosphate oxidase superfamily)